VADPDARRAKLRDWRRNKNPDRAKILGVIHSSRRRARIDNVLGDHDAADIERLLKACNRCHICGKPFSTKWPPTLDHVVPIAHALGTNDPGNLALAHEKCNKSKGAKRLYLI
jgi:5-methylcytosine-specific restriction endonuclease McrA